MIPIGPLQSAFFVSSICVYMPQGSLDLQTHRQKIHGSVERAAKYMYHVSRRIVAEQRVLASEEPEGQDVSLAVDTHAIVVIEVREDELDARPLLGHRWDQDYQCKET
jgi:hypothetical protein